MNTFSRMCEPIDLESYIRWVLGFGMKTGYDKRPKPDSIESHWTCPVWDLLPETFRRTPERSIGLVRWPHKTCPVGSLPTALFVVRTINRPSPTPLGLLATQKNEKLPWDLKLELSPLSLKLQSWFLFLREDLSSLECATFKQEHLTLSLDNLIAFVTIGDSIPKTARCCPGAPKVCGEIPGSLYCPPLYGYW
jgi:hypothetical protein